MLSSVLLPFKSGVEIFKFFFCLLLLPITRETKCFLCKFRFNFSIGIFMAKSNKFHLITYLPCPLCVCKSLLASLWEICFNTSWHIEELRAKTLLSIFIGISM
jgi:hypothetical protein